MALEISTTDTRAAFLTGGAVTWQQPSGPDADATNGAQTIGVLADREGTPVVRFVRGTAGTVNIVIPDSDGVDWFISVSTGGVLSASATVVA